MRIISGNKKGHKLITKKNQSARPISDKNRETIFNLLAHGNGIVETGFSVHNCKILDVFAGTGSFSFAQSFTQADIAGTGSAYADFGNVTVHTAGSTGTAIPGTITSGHATAIAGVNLAGSSVTAQFVSEVTAF